MYYDHLDCESCPHKSLCNRGFVIDCETGEILDPPGEDYSSAFYKELKAQNGD